MKIYLASSWRNKFYPLLLCLMEQAGYEVYDFRNPPSRRGFAFSNIDSRWQEWSTEQYIEALADPIAEAGFESDMNALKDADVCVILLPCGRSAHLGAGYAIGAGKPTCFFIPEQQEPELMYLMGSRVVATTSQLQQWLKLTAEQLSKRERGDGDGL